MLRPGSLAWRGLALLCWAISLAGMFAPQDTVAPVAALVLIAINLEVLQHLIQPSRFFSYYDMAANLAGVGLAAMSLMPLSRYLDLADK